MHSIMSVTHLPNRFPSPPPHRPMYPHPSEGSERTGMQLPPMSSLLPRHEQQRMGQEPLPFHRPSQSFPSHLSHPLQFSEMNPTAPVHHLYHAPQPINYASAPIHQAEPVLVPAQNRRLPLSPIQYEAPQPQRRQSKKISQRRVDFSKEQDQVNRSPASMERRYDESATGPRSFEPERPSYSPQSIVSPPLVSPRESQPKSVPIENLLSGSPSDQSDRPPPKYALIVRQQPESARACGFGERDRRVVDPPPILVLDIDEPTNRPETYVVHCTLWNPEMDEDDSAMPVSTERRQQRRLMGTNIASPFFGKDENNVDKCFFTFPDLSVRTPGTYSLRFTLVVLDQTRMGNIGYKAPVTAMVKTNAFQVFNAKDFRGMRASTALTKSLKAQGCLIPVKKGNSRAGTSRARGEDGEDGEDGNGDDDMDDDEDDDDEETRSPTNRGKRAKR